MRGEDDGGLGEGVLVKGRSGRRGLVGLGGHQEKAQEVEEETKLHHQRWLLGLEFWGNTAEAVGAYVFLGSLAKGDGGEGRMNGCLRKPWNTSEGFGISWKGLLECRCFLPLRPCRVVANNARGGRWFYFCGESVVAGAVGSCGGGLSFLGRSVPARAW